MVTYMPRSAWTPTAPGGALLTASKLIGCSVHYPASGNVIMAGMTAEQVAARLRGWRSYHVNTRGWSDIGYQVAVDGAGRVWDLRGIGRVPAASASPSNPDANREWGACLFVVGNSENPTAAAIEAFQHWRFTRWLARWPRADLLSGHGQVPGASTSCPGSRLRALIADRTLYRRPPTAPPPPPPPRPTIGRTEAMFYRWGTSKFRATAGDRVLAVSEADFVRNRDSGVPYVVLDNATCEAWEKALIAETAAVDSPEAGALADQFGLLGATGDDDLFSVGAAENRDDYAAGDENGLPRPPVE